MDIENFIKKEALIDLSFFNFSNAVTAAYFASSELEVLRTNDNFHKFFPLLKDVRNAFFRRGKAFRTSSILLEDVGVSSSFTEPKYTEPPPFV